MARRKIFDCFTFFNEVNLLRLRTLLLRDVVDYFVVVESSRTFTGKSKPYHFDFDYCEVPPSKVILVQVDDMPGGSAWTNETHQRNAILRGLTSASSNDIVLVSDVDEIPNPCRVQNIPRNCVVAHLQQKLFYYAWNNLVLHRATGLPVVWTAAKMTTMKSLKGIWGTPQNLRSRIPMHKSILRRVLNRLGSHTIEDGGWHWSYIMSPEEISTKILSFSHTEFSSPDFSAAENIRQRISSGLDPFDRDFMLQAVAPESLFPEFIDTALHEKFPQFFKPVNP